MNVGRTLHSQISAQLRKDFEHLETISRHLSLADAIISEDGEETSEDRWQIIPFIVDRRTAVGGLPSSPYECDGIKDTVLSDISTDTKGDQGDFLFLLVVLLMMSINVLMGTHRGLTWEADNSMISWDPLSHIDHHCLGDRAILGTVSSPC